VKRLTVFCVYWGDKYHKGYVYALRDAVKKYLCVDHEFVCITTDKFEGITTRLPFVSYSGWWQKIGLFAPGVATGPSLYFDLDVVIKGSIDYLVPYTENQLAAPANWAASGHGGIQSSVMAWAGNWIEPYEAFKPQWPQVKDRLWGDQEFLWELLGDTWARLPGVCSYKYHARNGEPNEPVIVFHGKPDPHEVHDQWILPFTSTLRNRITGSTPSGSKRASINTA
jgi:hypothetical protein